MTLLVMLRHGDTPWTRDGLVQGRTDISLDAPGRAALSALRVPTQFSGLSVVTSPLLRCVQTAQQLGLRDALVEPRIAEMSWGAWEGKRLRDLRRALGAEMETNEGRGLDFRPPGGESPREVLARVRPWMEELAEQDVPTLAICHRGVMRVVFASAMRWDMTGKAPAKLDWTALQVFELTVGAGVQVVALNAPLQRAHVSPPDAPVAPTGGSS